jgi:uncharacterized NAD(P)/FAD-binding protein YdhS
MSAFPDKPGHFVDWLRNREWSGAGPALFAPRNLYGEYLEDTFLAEARRGNRSADFEHVRAEVTGIAVDGESAVLTLSDGSRLGARRVVLALGNPASSSFSWHLTPADMEDRWHDSPWLEDSLRVRRAGEEILVLGTGLTAVDSALAVFGQGKECRVHMVSRRGILPQVHRLASAVQPLPAPPQGGNLRVLLREMRQQIRCLRERGLCWRTAIDALRPVSNQLWSELSLQDRRTFVRHLKGYWENHRHRMAPEILDRINTYRKAGALQVVAARPVKSMRRGDAIEVQLRRRDGADATLLVDRVINCMGIQERYAESSRPLIRDLVSTGLASPNDLGTGFRSDEHGALVDADGRPSLTLFTLGPPRRGELFETTAVPEIRVQAAALARHLSGR